MTCVDVQERLLDPLDAEVEDHLESCGACAELARALREVDRQARALRPPSPPEDLVALTLARMEAEIARDRTPVVVPLRPRGRLLAGGGALLALAAGALLLVQPSPPKGDPTRMVERGTGERLPEVALKVAVRHQGEVRRLSRTTRYVPGDELYFRAQVDAPAWVALVRSDAAGARVVHEQRLSAGEADLALAEGPLAWRIDPGESDAIFALVAAPGPLDASAVVDAFRSAYDPGRPEASCEAAELLSARCVAATVRVGP